MTTRCINCGLNLRKISKGTALDIGDNARQLLREWISPVVLSQEHALCKECNNLVTSSNSGSRRQFGHRLVCISCGVSLFSKRNYPVTSLQPPHRNKIEAWALEYAGTHLSHACRSCILRAERAVSRKPSKRSQARKDSVETESEEYDEEAKPDVPVKFTTLDFYNKEAKPMPGNKADPLEVKSISLPNYRRIQGGANCMFPQCSRDSVCVPLKLRQQFLTSHHIYIPTDACICRRHLDMQKPAVLGETLETFTGDQISDMMFLMKKYRPIDFTDIETMDEQLRMLWLGVSWEEFRDLLEQTPGLSNVEDSKLLLTIYLTKRRTGENEEVLASLFQMPRDELERKLQIIRHYFQIKPEAIEA